MSRSSATIPVSRNNPGDTRAAGSGKSPGSTHARGGRAEARAARLTCDLVPSRLLRLCLLLIVAQSTLLLLVSRLPWLVVYALIPVALLYGVFEWRRLGASVGRLSTAERRWYWQVKGGARREFRFVGELTLWRWLIVINGKDVEGRRLRLVLARDAATADEWRRLLVALRYSR
ncbi:protein YgfX [Microbulbifer agarilyticus]|uniref:protein YgfX n=1 Tax=Microbulbifer agarilyticus TaxID=260552 RepID=UPI0021E5B6B8|nr:protein YgfX [Microbulbifer agarilyticus]